jgi:hypothetical protein
LLKDNDKHIKINTTLKAIKNNNSVVLSSSPTSVTVNSLDDCSLSTKGSVSSNKTPISINKSQETPTYKRYKLSSTERTDKQLSSLKFKQNSMNSQMLEYHAFVDLHKGVLSSRKSTPAVVQSSTLNVSNCIASSALIPTKEEKKLLRSK